jgi:hypothetical protein
VKGLTPIPQVDAYDENRHGVIRHRLVISS